MNPGNLGDTLPKLLCRNAREHRDEVALREKEFGVWRSPGASTRRGPAPSRSACGASA